ncbi:hypothetical protein HOY82DRAFT_616701 [Tuber indicum]|nr:hypothetical protein HOY82DRAFT_616701 [Tuber indicum]
MTYAKVTCRLVELTTNVVKYSTVVNEPIMDIRNRTYNGHIAALAVDFYHGDERAIPVGHFGGKQISSLYDLRRFDGLAVPGGILNHMQVHVLHSLVAGSWNLNWWYTLYVRHFKS